MAWNCFSWLRWRVKAATVGGCCVISSLTGHLLQIIVLQRNIGHIQKHQRSLAKALVSIAKPLLTENVVLVVLMVVVVPLLLHWRNGEIIKTHSKTYMCTEHQNRISSWSSRSLHRTVCLEMVMRYLFCHLLTPLQLNCHSLCNNIY